MSFQVRRLQESPPRRPIPWKAVAAWAFALRRPFLGLVERWKIHRQEHAKHEKRVRILKRVAIGLAAVLCSLILIAGTVKALVAMRVLNLNSIFNVAGADLPKDAFGHTNLLLLGQGDAGHDGQDLTDTMMIASIDPTTKSVVMLSLPRDLYLLDTKNMGRGRINGMYQGYKHLLRTTIKQTEADASQVAMVELADELGKLLGMKIHHTVKVDFIGFVKAVDAVGGFEIDVPADLVDTQYPNERENGYTTFIVRAGLQQFDGSTALKYARSRHSTSDFDRSARQQMVLKALADKLKQDGVMAHPDRILSLWNILSENMETTMTLRELIGLAELGTEIDRSNILSMQLNDQVGYTYLAAPGGFLYAPPRDQFGGASVLLPVSIPQSPVTWKQIQSLVTLLVHTRSPYVAHPLLEVYNAGAKAGSSRSLSSELTRYGFDVTKAENAPDGEHDKEKSYIQALQADAALAQFFGTLLKIPVATLPEGALLPPKTIQIYLGKDYAYVPFQSLLPSTNTGALGN